MTEKKKKQAKISKKAIVSILLLIAMVFSLSVFTYAWYRNYVDVKGTSMKTGKISLQVDGYGVDSEGSVTSMDSIIIDGETENSVVIDSAVTKIDTWNKAYHVYYFIKNPKTDTSIDIDASVTVALDNSAIDDKLGGITVDINQIKTDNMTGKLSDFDGLTEEQIIASISAGAESIVPETDGIAFNDLENSYQEFSVPVGEYVCLRLTYEMPNNLANYSDIDLDVRVSFCLAQKNGLPGATTYSEYVVYSLANLQSVLAKYRPNDKIIIKGNIEYEGDLIITRPLTLEVQNARLDIRGNLIYAYAYEGHFAINTQRGGSIAVFKRDVDQFDEDGNLIGTLQLGGNFEIQIPLSQMELMGKGSTNASLGDIYVEGDFNVTASMSLDNTLYKQGLIINGSMIRPITDERGDTQGYKNISVGDSTGINVMSGTEIGVISSSSSLIEIENRGTIGGIELQYMHYDGDHTSSSPQILINNYNLIRNSAIRLPINWAERFVDNGDGTYSGNTRIISQPGAKIMTVSPATNGFISDGSGNPETDHIEYVTIDTFVEKVNGRSDCVIIQYTGKTGLYVGGTATDIGTDLETLLGYYSGSVSASETQNSNDARPVNSSIQVASAENLVSVKIICYSKQLTGSDYAFLRSMGSLVELDLSDAESVNKAVPAGAFMGMNKLKNVTMSAHDTSWGNNIFLGTSVDEIRLPNSLSTVYGSTFENIKYIHTASKSVSGVAGGGRLIFVPDITTFNYYNNGNNGRVFYDAQRYAMDTGDYFLRLDKETLKAEFVAFSPSNYPMSQFDVQSERNGEARFDFNTITVNGDVYTVNVYGTYSFYGKTFVNVDSGELTISSNTDNVEAYAFGEVKGFNTITINGTPMLEPNSFRSMTVNNINISGDAEIGNNAFTGSTAVSVSAPNVKKTGTNSFSKMTNLVTAYFPSLRRTEEPFRDCTRIFRLDIGIFEENTKFGTACTVNYIFIHTDETDIASNIDYTLSYTGSNSDGSRVLFVPTAYAGIYKYYGAKINIGDVDIDNIKEFYDPNDENIVGTAKQPNMYYLDNLDGTAVILRYLKSTPKSTTNIFAIPKNDGSGEYYDVTRISEYAYRGTSISRDELIFPSTVTEVGEYAFEGTNKNIGTINLSNVTRVGRRAFENNSCAVIIGEEVYFAGDYAFAKNKKVLKIVMPKLSAGAKTDDYGGYFYQCTELIMAHVGPLDNNCRDYIFWSCTKLRLVIIDGSNRNPSGNYPKDPFWTDSVPTVLVMGDSSVKENSYDGGRGLSVKVNPDFSNVVVSGSETYSTLINNKIYSVTVPKSIYKVNNDGTAATIVKYLAKNVDQERFSIPANLLYSDSTVDLMGIDASYVEEYTDTVDGGITVTEIRKNTFRDVTFGETVFNTGKVTTIGNNGLQGLKAKYIELDNVISLGSYALKDSSTTTISANNLKSIGTEAFTGCSGLREVYIPAVQTLGSWAFYKTGLTSITLGENLTSIGSAAFANCPNLEEIILLSSASVTLPTDVFISGNNKTTVPGKIHIVVRENLKSTYESQWGGIVAKIESFENSYTDSETGLTYFYSTVFDTTVELSFFKSSGNLDLGAAYVFPSSFTALDANMEEQTYVVGYLSDLILSQIGNISSIESIELPSGILSLSDNMSSIPSTVKAIIVDEENSVYKTENGVLYTKDGKTLLYYPRGKSDTEFTIPDTVETVVESAFADNDYLRKVTINTPKSFANKCFYQCVVLVEVRFTCEDASLFIGVGNFDRCNSTLEIFVPESSADEYKNSILFDTNARDKIVTYTE